MKKKKYNVIPHMFDVKPQEVAGENDVERISQKYSKIIKLKKEKRKQEKTSFFETRRRENYSIKTKEGRPVKKNPYKEEFIEELAGKAKTRNIFQLNQFVGKDETPSYIRIKDSRKFLGASKPFLNRNYGYDEIADYGARAAGCETENDGEFSLKELLNKKSKTPREKTEHIRLIGTEEGKQKAEEFKRERIKRAAALRRKKARKRRAKKLFSSLNPLGIFFKPGEILKKAELTNPFSRKKQALGFAAASVLLLCGFWSVKVITYGIQIQDDVAVKGREAVGEMVMAGDDLQNQDFEGMVQRFSTAKKSFQSASDQLDRAGGSLLNIFSSIPGLSKAGSGRSLVEAGEKITKAAEELGSIALIFSENKKEDNFSGGSARLKELYHNSSKHLNNARQSLEEAGKEIEKVKIKDLPAEYREDFSKIKKLMPVFAGVLDNLKKNHQVFWEILGFDGTRRYLLVFQNNHEARATGGFIGSYGVLEMNEGGVENLFIDGIYNPDGQLREKVVPPKPIQKISAAWSTHDANWFPHFPTSAEKIAWFYEKTGGPTVDGVIAITPAVMEKFLEVTGPIEMPEYETTINAENFIEKTQHEVEVDYDREENRPKKFLADLAPKVIDKLLSANNASDLSKTLGVLSESLREKHILIHSFNESAQQIVSEQGWAGEVLPTGRDYLMVVNSNINGFKTDGVIDEDINHRAEIQPDGSIVSTVTVTRRHNGGDTDYEWWNKVNANYMRVYVPEGSKLISAKGHTREVNEPPLDYDKLGFRRDSDVEKQEASIEIDRETGTRVYKEENKTVFANWVYVSPQEKVEVEYQYVLPFKVDFSKKEEGTDAYSLLAQKQHGSSGSNFSSEVSLPEEAEVFWQYPESLSAQNGTLKFSQKLEKDLFYGVVLKER